MGKSRRSALARRYGRASKGAERWSANTRAWFARAEHEAPELLKIYRRALETLKEALK
jgi:hypothetical protein